MPTLFIVCVIDILGFGILIPLVPYMADRFGASPQLITPILGAYSLCQLVAPPFGGGLVFVSGAGRFSCGASLARAFRTRCWAWRTTSGGCLRHACSRVSWPA